MTSLGMRRVRLEISATPAPVRTARLVAVATARQAGVAEELLDDVRLAVGEACARAVSLHRVHQRPELVRIEFTGGARFAVTVHDTAPADAVVPATADPLVQTPTGVPPVVDGGYPVLTDEVVSEEMVAGVGPALLAGLVDDLRLHAAEDGRGTVVHMSWPLA